MDAQTVELLFDVPFNKKNNRKYLTRQQLNEMPELIDFIERFPSCFKQDPFLCIFYFYPEGNSPHPVSPSMLRRMPLHKEQNHAAAQS